MTFRDADPLGVLIIDSGTGRRTVKLGDYLDGEIEEQAASAAHAWIKSLRLLSVEGQPLRRRFQYRGDSLWWFTELYLHKQQVILGLHRTIAALERLVAVERPLEMRPVRFVRLLDAAGAQVAAAHRVRWTGAGRGVPAALRILAIGVRARGLRLAARASRVRRRPGRADAGPGGAAPAVAAFVHTAFWRRGAAGRGAAGSEAADSQAAQGGAARGGAESYIGPVLQALDARAPRRIRYVGVGPAANFRARRWWHGVKGAPLATAVVPIETFAGLGALAPSEALWRERHALLRALTGSAEIRQHAVIRGCDCWTIVREELAGVVLLQWTWSARAMDEAGAALDAIRPRVALTYAEAGGWGRALMVECRRRGIPSAGLQHGFIYRHWLNYRHEADEMLPDPAHPADTGFPRPSLTLLFDDFARQHLVTHGRFPPDALAVTGSPRLDALVDAASRMPAEAIVRARAEAGAAEGQHLILLVTKHREATGVLPALVDAVRAMPEVQLAIKTHPAETSAVYAAAAAGAPNIRVLPAEAPLAPLIRASRAVITVNSTVAVDAAVLGVPALVLGLPNNLSPFVDAGVMMGVPAGGPIETALHHILYNEQFRLQLEADRGRYLAAFGIGSDGRAADRSAEAVLSLARPDGWRRGG